MTTNQKNQWIALEERYQKSKKEKNKTEHSGIMSQLTFCSDGVIIRKYPDLENHGGISVLVVNKTRAEVKENESAERVCLEVLEFGKEEFEEYTAIGSKA